MSWAELAVLFDAHAWAHRPPDEKGGKKKGGSAKGIKATSMSPAELSARLFGSA